MHDGICLAWRAGVELVPVFRQVLQSIGLDELERIPGLWLIVHAHDLGEADTGIPHSRPTCATE